MLNRLIIMNSQRWLALSLTWGMEIPNYFRGKIFCGYLPNKGAKNCSRYCSLQSNINSVSLRIHFKLRNTNFDDIIFDPSLCNIFMFRRNTKTEPHICMTSFMNCSLPKMFFHSCNCTLHWPHSRFSAWWKKTYTDLLDTNWSWQTAEMSVKKHFLATNNCWM